MFAVGGMLPAVMTTLALALAGTLFVTVSVAVYVPAVV
jgi:hypothetical protein